MSNAVCFSLLQPVIFKRSLSGAVEIIKRFCSVYQKLCQIISILLFYCENSILIPPHEIKIFYCNFWFSVFTLTHNSVFLVCQKCIISDAVYSLYLFHFKKTQREFCTSSDNTIVKYKIRSDISYCVIKLCGIGLPNSEEIILNIFIHNYQSKDAVNFINI